ISVILGAGLSLSYLSKKPIPPQSARRLYKALYGYAGYIWPDPDFPHLLPRQILIKREESQNLFVFPLDASPFHDFEEGGRRVDDYSVKE
ncbi:MAG: hypothetical protein O3A33_14145, partial [Chloroflexi bacterium]|nr:hypothetical protein [Chloroflexota bacterium]